MERWLWVTKSLLLWEKLADNEELQCCLDQSFRKGQNVVVYRSGNHRDLAYIFEVKNDSELSYGKYKTTFHKRICIRNPLKLAELKKDPQIKKWKSKFYKEFYNIPFNQWNKIIALISQKNPDLFKKHELKCCSGPNSHGFPLNYKNSFFDIIEKIKNCEYKDSFNEETTKQLIIIPLLQKIGWNTYDVCEVHPEHSVHYKSRRVDYILRDHEGKQVCVEAKKVSETDFDFHEEQLLHYCAHKHADIGILTNGIIWRFYRIHYHSKELEAIKNIDLTELDLIIDNPNKILDIFVKYLWRGKITTKERDEINIPSLGDIIDTIQSMKLIDKNKFNEEAMKQGIILPLLINIGWNTFDPLDIAFQKSIKIPIKKKHQKIDYILGKNSNKIIIEVKGLATDISNQNVLFNDERHVLEYMKAGNYEFGVLTNGILWKFYLFKNKLFWGTYKINVQEKNFKKEDFTSLISKQSVLNGKHLSYLEKLV